ncbi:hypothetical protein LCGC14_2325540 [marine sediment metagenome]|uniref:YopX protein domain-containing protein n=1 Tax=marine sediment metagenome TaxID=412755 RepID=A0A0F9D428_9ZZZZ
MREIKFRAWNKIVKEEMRYNILNIGNFDKKYWEITEFTGLKDKNGKEIYEGDIVKAFYENEEEYGLVFWNKEIAGFDVEGKKWKSVENLYCSWKYYEVIGNKFENQELLK